MRRTASWRTSVLNRGALRLAVFALVALAVACGDGRQPVNPASPSETTAATVAGSSGLTAGTAASSAAASQTKTVPRQVAGVTAGRFDFTHTWGSEWWQFYSDGDTKGTLSHLGLTRVLTRHIPNLETGALEQGEFRMVAANGDEIRGTYAGSATYLSAVQLHGVATFIITGGTGRFLHATGTIAATFVETLDDPTWASAKVIWSFDGTVNY